MPVLEFAVAMVVKDGECAKRAGVLGRKDLTQLKVNIHEQGNKIKYQRVFI